jgi:hypothetical protein
LGHKAVHFDGEGLQAVADFTEDLVPIVEDTKKRANSVRTKVPDPVASLEKISEATGEVGNYILSARASIMNIK